MRRSMMLANIAGVLSAVLLVACGGGGSGGGGGNGATLSLSVSAVNFSVENLGSAAPSRLVTATVNGTVNASVVYIRVQVDGDAVSGVDNLQIVGNSGSGFLRAAPPQSLGPGRYTSTVTITACTSGPACTSGIIGSPQAIAVTYDVNGLLLSSTSVNYTLGVSPLPSDYSRSFTVRAYPSVVLTPSVPWLTATPGTGTGGGTLNVTAALVQNTVDALDSGMHQGVIAVNVPGQPPAEVAASLEVARPQLDQVAPYIAIAGSSGTVALRGLYLNQLPDTDSIDLLPQSGGAEVAPTSISRLSATEMRITHPALAAGGYQVRMKNASGAVISGSRARLYVHEPPGFAGATLQYPGGSTINQPRQILFDAERNALWLIVDHPPDGLAATQLLRYTFANGAWSGPAIIRTAPASGMALASNGQTLYLSSRAESASSTIDDLLLIDPATFQVRKTLHPPLSNTNFVTFAHANNGDLFTVETSRDVSNRYVAYRLDFRTESLTVEPGTTFGQMQPDFRSRQVAGSADGSRVLFGNGINGIGGSDGRLHEFNASTGMATQLALVIDINGAQFDRFGDRALLDASNADQPLYDRNWQLLGTLPRKRFGAATPTATTTYQAVLAPGGTEAYTYTWGGTVLRFDLAASAAGAEYVPDVTPLALDSSPEVVVGESSVVMAMSPDSRTLFIAGGAGIVVVPVP